MLYSLCNGITCGILSLLKGERLLKDVYEALRASPKWNKTVLFVAYDDAGGYYDHMVPPFEGALIG